MTQPHGFSPDAAGAAALDRQDVLQGLRDRFYLAPGTIYLDGNSLGLASVDAEAALLQAVAEWKNQAIRGWTREGRPWFYYAEELGALQAPLVGAAPDEVVVTGSTTVNLHTLAATFYRPAGRRTRIVTAAPDFPSNLYALQSQVRLHGLDPAEHLVLVPSRDGRTLAEDDLIAAMDDQAALVVLSAVLYRSGQLLDMARLTRAARERGIGIGFDCSHSAGCVPHRLDAWDVDFAYWCNYKYLNGGPGAVASLYVNRRHFGTLPGLAGWFGSRKDRQFELLPEFIPAGTAGAWQISTTSVFGAACLYGALQVFREAGLEKIRAKSLRQTAYLIYLADHYLAANPYGFSVGTPREDHRRGGHVALEHPDARGICLALQARGIVADFRPPNVLRLAPTALYTRYRDLWDKVQALREIVDGLAKV